MNTCLKHQQQYNVQAGGFCPYCGKPREHGPAKDQELLELKKIQEQMQEEQARLAREQWDRVRQMPHWRNPHVNAAAPRVPFPFVGGLPYPSQI